MDAMDQLNALIDTRAKHRDAESEREAMYAESVRRYHERRRKRNRAAWCAFHAHMQNLHLGLAKEHAEKAAGLAGEEDTPSGWGEGVSVE